MNLSPDLLVLLVEDEFFIRLDAVDMLERAGFAVRDACSADDALASLEGESFDVLVTDVMMPGTLDGLELAHRVIARWATPTVIVSAVAVADAALPDGAVFLKKPYTHGELLNAIEVARSLRQAGFFAARRGSSNNLGGLG